MKKLVVNADDFGISPGVSHGIVEAFQKGIVRSTSLMVNLPSAQEACRLASGLDGLKVGIHLNLTCGVPVSPSALVPTLVDRNGKFHSLPRMLLRLLSARIRMEEIVREWDAQIARARDFGIHPSHLDTHHHVHFHPALATVLWDLAVKHGILRVRKPGALLKLSFWKTSMFAQGAAYSSLAKLFALKGMGKLSRLPENTPSWGAKSLWGIGYIPAGEYQTALERFLPSVNGGITEIVCHPGYVDSELSHWDSWTESREEELRALTSEKTVDLIRSEGIQLAA